MIEQTEKAVILLLKPKYVNVPDITTILQKQKKKLTQLCQDEGFDVLTTVEISENGKELFDLGNAVSKEADQRIAYVFEEYSQTRIFEPQAFVAFNKKVIQAIGQAMIEETSDFEPAGLRLLIKKELFCEECTVSEELANVNVTKTKH